MHSPHHDTAATSYSLTPSMGKVNKHTVLAVPFLMELGRWKKGKSSSMETQDWQQRKGASKHWAMQLLAARVSTCSPEQVPHAMPKAKGKQRELSEWKDLSSGKDGEATQGAVWIHGSG